EAPLYGYIVLFVSSKVIDLVLEGWNFTKMAIITSTKTAEIQEFILNSLERSGTALKSRSLFLNREGETIITVISPKQLMELRAFIKKADPDAFVIVNDTYAVLGRGFKAHHIG
ncbi:MAG: YitT family protein, partial [Candidatus Aminicenantales bacterium]